MYKNAGYDKKLVRLTAIMLSIDKNHSGCQISRIRIRDSNQRRFTVSSHASTFNAEFIDTTDARGRAINENWYL